MTETPFEWPCDRRDAHKGHQIIQQGLGALPPLRSGESLTISGGEVTTRRYCPGVPAHPTTMIGGSYPPDR